MSRWRVAQQIISSVKKGEFILRRHAEERLAERRFSKSDDGAGFTAIRNKDGTYVITVFKRRIKKWEKKES